MIALCLSATMLLTLKWPLVGDASIIHYIVFLSAHGFKPYVDVVDPNFPGSYAVDWLVMHVYGQGSLAWRLFDYTLLLLTMALMAGITYPLELFSGIYAAMLFAMVHFRDGIDQAGERDLTMTVLLLAFFVIASRAGRAKSVLAASASGIFIGAAISIKPTAALFLVVPLVFSEGSHGAETKYSARGMVAFFIGMVAPWIAVITFLVHEHGVHAFFLSLNYLDRSHASLSRLGVWTLFTHSIPSYLLPLLILCLIIASLRREVWAQRKYRAICLAAIAGLASFMLQGKGYPYHRYPLLAFFLLAAVIILTAVMRAGGPLRWAGLVGLVWCGAWIAPVCMHKAVHYDSNDQRFNTALSRDLSGMGSLSGQIQCFDTTAGCINTLYDMRLVQSTGMIYDCYLFHDGSSSYIKNIQSGFIKELQSAPPRVLVVSNQYCLSGPNGYSKLSRWPELKNFINKNYKMYKDEKVRENQLVHWWSEPRIPLTFRIYVLKQKTL